MTTVGIVGLGLIGGSLARDLAAAGWRVLAADDDAATLAAARDDGVIDGALELDTATTDFLDLVVLAVPVRAAPATIRMIAASLVAGSDAVITDVGSTKRSIAKAALDAGLAARFVGSHPMAGSHRSGWSASRTGLFRDSRVWICPTATTEEHAMAIVEGMWRVVGSRPEHATPDDHDRLMARASHLPQIAATALAATLSRHGLTPRALGPGGRDATRLAGSDPDMWTDILHDNADHVAPAIAALAHELADIADLIRSADTDAIRARLATGRSWHDEPANDFS